MLILIPSDPLFDYKKVRNMWNECKDKLDDGKSFDEVLKDSHFYSFYVGNKFIGCIYFYQKEDGKLYLNAFAGRNTHKTNLKCLKKALTFYKCDVYAECKEKTAIFCILKIGFKKIGKNLYKYERG